MKYILKSALIGLLISTQALAGLPPTTTKGQSNTTAKTTFNVQVPNKQSTTLGGTTVLFETGNKNLLSNPSFEHSTVATDWTVTNSTASVNTTDLVDGKQSLTLTLAAQSGTLLEQTVTGSYTFNGVNLGSGCSIKTALTTIQVCALQGGVEVQCQSMPANSIFNPASINFAGAPGTVNAGVRVKATSSSTGTLVIDDCYTGVSKDIGAVAQTKIVASGYFNTTANCTFTRTNTALGALSDADCPGATVEFNEGPGTLLTTDFDAPKFQVNNLPPGMFKAHFIGSSYMASPNGSAYAVSDGTTTSGQVGGNTANVSSPFHVVGVFNYTTGGNRTFEFFGSSIGSSMNIDLTNGNQRLYFYLEYVPNQAQQVLNVSSAVLSWGGTSSLSGTTTSGSFADPGSVSGSITTTSSQNLTCTAASSLVGISCPLPRAGSYFVCYAGEMNQSNNATRVSAQLVDGSGNIIVGAMSTTPTNTTTTGAGGFGGCGLYNAATPATATFKVQGRVSGGGTETVLPGSFAVIGIPSFASPFLTGSITSNSSGALRMEYARVASTCSSSPCTITSGNDSGWLTSITWASTSIYTANIATGVFSAPPHCNVTTLGPAATTSLASSITATSFPFVTVNSGFTQTASAFSIMCIGPR